MYNWLWTWGGKCFGYRYQDDLFTYAGKHAGKFYGNEIYSHKGFYLGEVEVNTNRLITDKNKMLLRRFTFSRIAGFRFAKFSDYSGYAMYAGYEDFPTLTKFN